MKIFNFCLASVAVLFLAVSCGKEEYGMSGRKEVVGNDGYGLSAMTMDYDEVMGNLPCRSAGRCVEIPNSDN